jgi:hypothetical protein
MHRFILGFNLWAALALLLALALGFLGSAHHGAAGLLATILALLAQSAIFALFMGASKLMKEHVLRFGADPAFVARTNRLMLPLFRWALAVSLLLLLLGILGGLCWSRDVGPWPHAALGIATLAALAVALPKEVRALRAMHGLLAEMEARLPEPAAAVAAARPAGAGAAAADAPGAPRALAYVGATVIALVLGYRFISGLPLPDAAVVLGLALGSLCLIAAYLLRLRAAAAARSQP